jgi:hypothetical protein
MYKVLDTKCTNELLLLRMGWFSPEYELTDRADSYGKLSYGTLTRLRATAITANTTWIFQRDGLFSRTILVTDENGVFIGKATRELFGRRTVLTLQTGFQAEFYRPSIWSREYVWESSGYGRIMHIDSNLFSLKDTIYIDQSMTPPALIPLLIFFGAHLTILRRRRRAAHY